MDNMKTDMMEGGREGGKDGETEIQRGGETERGRQGEREINVLCITT